jgi:5-methylcytosine-specific restriction endonuclease McrA
MAADSEVLMNEATKRKIIEAASAKGLEVRFRGVAGSHVQILGPLLTNYYPDAKRRSAYVAGTTRRVNNVTPEQAVEMALKAPKIASPDRKAARHYSRKHRDSAVAHLRRRDGDKCKWCKELMVFRGEIGPMSATIEHIIPLNRGGLDNLNNMALAHKKCNNERGGDMPELEGKSA